MMPSGRNWGSAQRHCASRIGRLDSPQWVAGTVRATLRNKIDWARVVQTNRRDRRAKLPLSSRRPVRRRHNRRSWPPVRRSAGGEMLNGPLRSRRSVWRRLAVSVTSGATPQDRPSHRLSVRPSLGWAYACTRDHRHRARCLARRNWDHRSGAAGLRRPRHMLRS